jgi:hypothetical protein
MKLQIRESVPGEMIRNQMGMIRKEQTMKQIKMVINADDKLGHVNREI